MFRSNLYLVHTNTDDFLLYVDIFFLWDTAKQQLKIGTEKKKKFLLDVVDWTEALICLERKAATG